MVPCPSIHGKTPEQAWKDWRRALRKERVERVMGPIKRAMPEYAEGLLALGAGAATVATIIAVMVAIA